LSSGETRSCLDGSSDVLPQNSATCGSYALGTGVFVVLSVTARNKRDVRAVGRLDKFENGVVSKNLRRKSFAEMGLNYTIVLERPPSTCKAKLGKPVRSVLSYQRILAISFSGSRVSSTTSIRKVRRLSLVIHDVTSYRGVPYIAGKLLEFPVRWRKFPGVNVRKIADA